MASMRSTGEHPLNGSTQGLRDCLTLGQLASLTGMTLRSTSSRA